jgi:hypothetical protein
LGISNTPYVYLINKNKMMATKECLSAQQSIFRIFTEHYNIFIEHCNIVIEHCSMQHAFGARKTHSAIFGPSNFEFRISDFGFGMFEKKDSEKQQHSAISRRHSFVPGCAMC